MSIALALAIPLSLLIGLSLGLLGGGGSILTVPILVYALGVGAKEAIATSLLVVGITSAAAVLQHARAGAVKWRTGLLFGAAGMAGAYAAGRVAHFIPAQVLLVLFAVMMLVTAAAMLRGRRGKAPTAGTTATAPRRAIKVIGEGAVIGAVTGLVGAGGGFLVVPALVLLGGLPMRAAIGTSLLVIAMKSFAGFTGYLGHVEIDWALALIVSASAVAGSVAGSHLAGRVPQEMLRRGFAWFVIAMGAAMLVQRAPEVFGLDPLAAARLAIPWILGIAALAVVYLVFRPGVSKTSHPER